MARATKDMSDPDPISDDLSDDAEDEMAEPAVGAVATINVDEAKELIATKGRERG